MLLLLLAAGGGRAIGVGPLASAVAPEEVTDAREMIARSLQATLDADSVRVGGTLEGTLPGALLDQSEAAVDVGDTALTAVLRPRDARTQAHVTSPALGIDLETITIWTDAWSRSGGGPWQTVPMAEVTSDTGFDLNPLTLVDRLRTYLASSGARPTSTDSACESPSGRCHTIRLDAGTDPAGVLAGVRAGARPGLPEGGLPAVSTVVTLQTDALTLRPVRLEIVATSEDGTIDLRLALQFGAWNEPAVIEEPPDAGA